MPIPSLTTYGGALHPVGYDGEVVDMNTATIESLMNDQTTGIQFGNPVARSAADNTCQSPTVDADVIIGLAVRHAIMPAPGYGQTSANVVLFPQYYEVPVLRSGFMYKTAAENTTRGDQAISITADNVSIAATSVGSVTGGIAGTGRVVIPNCTWETTTVAGSIGILRINN